MSILRTIGSVHIMAFECLGDLDNPHFRFLDGRTAHASAGLAPSTDDSFTGTRWEVTTIADGIVTLKCLGAFEPPDHRRFLDGRTLDGTAELASRTAPPFSGTRWVLTELVRAVSLS